jgi:hypothetical protein
MPKPTALRDGDGELQVIDAVGVASLGKGKGYATVAVKIQGTKVLSTEICGPTESTLQWILQRAWIVFLQRIMTLRNGDVKAQS